MQVVLVLMEIPMELVAQVQMEYIIVILVVDPTMVLMPLMVLMVVQEEVEEELI